MARRLHIAGGRRKYKKPKASSTRHTNLLKGKGHGTETATILDECHREGLLRYLREIAAAVFLCSTTMV